MDKGDSELKVSRKRTALGVRLGMSGAKMVLDTARDKELYLPVTGGKYFLTGRGCQKHIGLNDFEVQESRSPGCFLVIPEAEPMFLLLCPASHTYIH